MGAATLDLHFGVEEQRARNSKGPARRFGMYAGGPAANAAVTFAHLGGSSLLYSEVGAHPLAQMIAGDLAAWGVDLVDLTPASADHPMVSSIVSFEGSGDRMAVSSHYPDVGSVPGLSRPLPEFDVLLVDGFLRGPCRDAVAQASARGVPVVLDGGSWKAGMGELLPMVDVAVCSADFRPPGTRTHDDALDHLQDLGVDRVAVTRGGDSILYRDGSVHGEVPVEHVAAVDTLGAGDVLHGAFCFHLAGGLDLAGALGAAAAVATLSCREFGTRSWMGERPGASE